MLPIRLEQESVREFWAGKEGSEGPGASREAADASALGAAMDGMSRTQHTVLTATTKAVMIATDGSRNKRGGG